MRPQHRFPIRLLLGTGALVLGAFVACDSPSPFEPRGEGERVPIGRVIEDEVSGDSAKWYSFAAGANAAFAVFFEAVQGNVFLAVIDSTHQAFVAGMSAGPGGPPLEENASTTFGTSTGAVYRLRVSTSLGGATARFRFKVYAIDRSPELVPATFAFGDTVTGETIDPIVDLDRFRVHGEAGEEIVAVAETQGPAGSGSVALIVFDPVTNDFLGYVYADAGTSNPLTTGRMRLPGTHDYQVTLGSVTSNQYPRYRGPYRFWSYLVNRAPEHRAAPISFDTEVKNEKIDRAGDVDEFTFVASAGGDYNAFVQGGGRTFQLEVAPQGGATFALASSQASDTALFAHATTRFHIAAAGTHVLRVTGTNPHEVADTGAYRVYLYAIDPRPEHVPATIAPGDTISGEDIRLPGDIDEFTFSGALGEEFNVALQARNGSPTTCLQLEVLNGTGTVLRTAESVGTDTSLLRQVTGRFALPGTGTYRLRVTGRPSSSDPYQYRGPYRLFLYRIDRRPESLPETLAFGDSLSGEAIDLPGDVDEFRVTVTDSSGANLVVELGTQPAEGTALVVQLVALATGDTAAAASTYAAGESVSSGRVRLGPGAYTLRVDASHYQERPVLRGAYRLWLYRFRFGPELVPDTFAIGDTVSREVIEPWGDADLFHFYGERGWHINVALQGLAGTSGDAFQAWISGPGNEPVWTFASVTSPASAPALGDHQTTRLDLPATGWYHVEMTGFGPSRGGYRLLVEHLGTAPEQVPAALAPGDSVMAESIDTPGDWDEFTVTTMPGRDLSIVFHGRSGFSGPFAYVRAFDPATGDTLASTVGQFRRLAGPFRAPASGEFKIAVFEPASFVRFCYDATCGGVFHFVGSYGFHLIPVSRAPESVPVAYTVGDTIRGETISPIGDVDEFTSSGTPGEQLAPFLRLTTQASLDSAAVLEVIDPATGASLVGSNIAIFGATFSSLGSLTVPASGSFVVRVRVYGEFGFGVGETSYEFFVKRGP